MEGNVEGGETETTPNICDGIIIFLHLLFDLNEFVFFHCDFDQLFSTILNSNCCYISNLKR